MTEDDTRRATLEAWLRHWIGDSVPPLAHVSLADGGAMARVVRNLVGCIIREILPLPKRYRNDAPGVAQLAALDPFAMEERPALFAALNDAGLAGRSALVALGYADDLQSEQAPEAAAKTWRSVFHEAGPLEMAVWRTKHAGADPARIAAVLADAARAL